MNNTKRPAGYPALDENRIEKLLSNIQPVPGKAFIQKMQNTPWKAVQTQGKIFMKTKFAFSALAMLLVLAAMVAFVPPVRAQVSKWFRVVYNHGSINVIGSDPMVYQVMQPDYLPLILSEGTIHVWYGKTSEVIYKADDKFLVITQTAVVDGESLPDGENVMVNGKPAVLNKELSGIYQEKPEGTPIFLTEAETYQGSLEGAINGGDIAADQWGGTSQPTTVDQVPLEDFITFNYTDSAKLTFTIGNTKIEMLSNVGIAELIKIAESLIPEQ